MRVTLRYGPALVAALALALTGCSRPAVTGTVTFDGQPVDGGAISFIAEGVAPNQAARAGAPIVGGKYAVPAGKGLTPGTYRVEIIWNKKTGAKVPVVGDEGTTTDATTQVIPARYNSQSTLKAEIKGGSTTLDYPLTP